MFTSSVLHGKCLFISALSVVRPTLNSLASAIVSSTVEKECGTGNHLKIDTATYLQKTFVVSTWKSCTCSVTSLQCYYISVRCGRSKREADAEYKSYIRYKEITDG